MLLSEALIWIQLFSPYCTMKVSQEGTAILESLERINWAALYSKCYLDLLVQEDPCAGPLIPQRQRECVVCNSLRSQEACSPIPIWIWPQWLHPISWTLHFAQENVGVCVTRVEGLKRKSVWKGEKGKARREGSGNAECHEGGLKKLKMEKTKSTMQNKDSMKNGRYTQTRHHAKTHAKP